MTTPPTATAVIENLIAALDVEIAAAQAPADPEHFDIRPLAEFRRSVYREILAAIHEAGAV